MRQLFEEFVPSGRELVESFNPRCAGGYDATVLEAANAVSSSDFSSITGQVISARVMQVLESPQFLWDKLCEVIPTAFNGERIAGIGRLGDEAAAIGEGESYPVAGVGEEYIETPAHDEAGLHRPRHEGGDLLRPHRLAAAAVRRSGRVPGREPREAGPRHGVRDHEHV